MPENLSLASPAMFNDERAEVDSLWVLQARINDADVQAAYDSIEKWYA